MVPIYLDYIPTATYGLWLASGNVLAWLGMADPGLSPLIQQRVAVSYGQRNASDLADYANSGFLLSMAAACTVGLAGLGAMPFLGILLSENTAQLAEIKLAFALTAVGAALMVLSCSLSAVMLGLQSGMGTGLVHSVSVTLSLAITLVLLFRGWGILALGIAAIFRGALFVTGNAIYLVWRVRADRLTWHWRFRKLRELALLGIGMFSARGFGVLAGNIDALLAARMLGPEAVPLLMLTKRAPEYCRSLAENPVRALSPILSELHGAGERSKLRSIIVRSGNILIWILGLYFCGFIALNGAFIRVWVGNAFYAGGTINTLLCLYFVAVVVTYAASSFSFSVGAIAETNRILIGQSLLMIVLMWAGAKWGGMTGLVSAQLIALVAMGGWMLPRLLAHRLELARGAGTLLAVEIGKTLIAASLTIFATRCVHLEGGLELLLGIGAVCTSYVAIMAAISPLFRSELRVMRDKLKHDIARRGGTQNGT